MTRKIFNVFLLCCFLLTASGANKELVPQPIQLLLNRPYMQGCSFSLMAQEVETGEEVYSYEADRQLTPASVLKTVTTATALELLGPDYRFQTSLEYDGNLKDGKLEGNLYIRGGGDPTLGSAHFSPDKNTYTSDRNKFIPEWIAALRKAGIREIEGAVIADESIFDTEGISMKWVREDLGSYYGAGSYGISAFDNLYRLYIRTGKRGSRPEILRTDPDMPTLRFHNYLRAKPVSSDSSYITGAPFASDRYLYGIVPANRESYRLRGDIPDPALFLAEYLTRQLEQAGISVKGKPTCSRILQEEGRWETQERKIIHTTYSPSLGEIVEVANHASHNLFVDALLKTIGLSASGTQGSSFTQGIEMLRAYWEGKGLDTSSLWMYDGCGLAVTDKVSTRFITDLLVYMATQSENSEAFIQSLPQPGIDGTVRNFLKGSRLQGKTRLKSGGMSRIKSYAGYITKGGKRYAIALIVNNYACDSRVLNRDLEELLLKLF